MGLSFLLGTSRHVPQEKNFNESHIHVIKTDIDLRVTEMKINLSPYRMVSFVEET